MSALGTILRELVGEAEVDRPASRRLSSGLTVAVRLTQGGRHCLSLTRTQSTPPSRKEAETCADHLGWAEPKITTTTTRDGRPCLLVWQGVTQGAGQAAPAADTPAQPAPPMDRDRLITDVLTAEGQRDAYWAPGGIGHEGRRSSLQTLSDAELLDERARFRP